MKKSNRVKQNKVIEAAGGVLWIKTPSGLRLAVIHRQRYNDWTLPKGKRKQGELWQETALREVFEETGCQAILGNFIGSASYSINHQMTPKVVLFWNMYTDKRCNFQPTDEVDRIKWVSPRKALKLLDYQDEREIIRNSANQNHEDFFPI